MSQINDAVSPIIGVILIVAITIILAAIVASFVFGTMGNFDRTILISVDAERINNSHIKLTNFGGKDQPLLVNGSAFHVIINGQSVDWVNPSDNLQKEIGSSAYYDISSSSRKMGLDDIQITAILDEGAKAVIFSSKI